MSTLHPAAPHQLPPFIPGPDGTDTLMLVMAGFLVLSVFAVGTLFLRLHTLPERLAHRRHKLQFEIVAVLGLLALFTHIHLFWVAGLLLALVDLPDLGSPLTRMARALESIAGRSAPMAGEATVKTDAAPQPDGVASSAGAAAPAEGGEERRELAHA